MKTYRYVGDGAGVPGLPHEISDEEATAQGLAELLRAAIENGSYVEVEADVPPSPPTPLPKGEGRRVKE